MSPRIARRVLLFRRATTRARVEGLLVGLAAGACFGGGFVALVLR